MLSISKRFSPETLSKRSRVSYLKQFINIQVKNEKIHYSQHLQLRFGYMRHMRQIGKNCTNEIELSCKLIWEWLKKYKIIIDEKCTQSNVES